MHGFGALLVAPVAFAVPLAAAGCRADGAGSTADEAAFSISPPSPEAALAAWEGPRVLDVPLYPDAVEAPELQDSMRIVWIASGQPAQLFETGLGERILVTDAPFDSVRDFYLPYVHSVFMDHEMVVQGAGPQRMFTGLMFVPDGPLVKFTITRPFFRYPDQQRIDRTVLQLGRVSRTP